MVEDGVPLRIDLDVGGWFVTLRGTVVGLREEPRGVVVALGATEREKINYLNGYVRGGLLNLREKRRLPVRLSVTYGAIEGPATTFTKDINEEGVFLFTDKPLPETSQVHMLVAIPDRPQPFSVFGRVTHTILPHDDEPPGMGLIFELDDTQRATLGVIVKEARGADARRPPAGERARVAGDAASAATLGGDRRRCGRHGSAAAWARRRRGGGGVARSARGWHREAWRAAREQARSRRCGGATASTSPARRSGATRAGGATSASCRRRTASGARAMVS